MLQPITVSWSKIGEILNRQRVFEDGLGHLVVVNALVSDTGTYICSASDQETIVTSNISVIVQGRFSSALLTIRGNFHVCSFRISYVNNSYLFGFFLEKKEKKRDCIEGFGKALSDNCPNGQFPELPHKPEFGNSGKMAKSGAGTATYILKN